LISWAGKFTLQSQGGENLERKRLKQLVTKEKTKLHAEKEVTAPPKKVGGSIMRQGKNAKRGRENGC